MSSQIEPVAGPFAARALARPATGRVIAVFAAVFYAEFAAGLVCVARRDIAPGPLTLVTNAHERTDWRSRLATETKVVAGPATMRIGPLALGLSPLTIWHPPKWHPVRRETLFRSLAHLRAERLPPEGLAPTILGLDAIARSPAAAPLSAATRWLAGDPDTSWVSRLVGLGPGLTPSGDDFLGGMMLALHATGQRALAKALAAAAAPSLPTTNAISAALVRAAAEGLGAAPLHRAINRLLGGDDPARALDDVAGIGHTSGFDALAGVVAVLDALTRPALAA